MHSAALFKNKVIWLTVATVTGLTKRRAKTCLMCAIWTAYFASTPLSHVEIQNKNIILSSAYETH